MKTFKKIFSCALVVISFILIFTSWTMLTPNAKEAAVEYCNETILPDQDDTNFSRAMKRLARLDLSDLEESDDVNIADGSLAEAMVNAEGVRSLALALADGGLDITQTTLAARTIKNIYTYLFENGTLFRQSGEPGYIRTSGLLSVYSVVVTILFIITVLLAIATFIVRFFDRFKNYRKYDLAFFIAQLLLFIMAIIFVGTVNSYFSGFPAMGISLWGIIALILACPYLVIDKIPFERSQVYIGASPVVNETAYAVSGTVTRTMDKISNKMDETAQGVRLIRELKANEENLKEQYVLLGKKFYSDNQAEPPEEYKDAFFEIGELKERSASIQKDIDIVNNVVACTSCGTRWTAGTKFCANCGAKLPDNVEDKEEFDNDLKLKKEKKAGKSFCKYCGAKIEEDDDFCPGCG